MQHSEIAPYLAWAIDRCTVLGVEANVRYMPLCQIPGREAHVYTGYQLPYDPHEWDYNSWYDCGHEGQPTPGWYLAASQRQQQRHSYCQPQACADCALRHVCDGFHAQYLARWGADEAVPHDGPPITDPRHFIQRQTKIAYDTALDDTITGTTAPAKLANLAAQHLPIGADGRAGVKRTRTATS